MEANDAVVAEALALDGCVPEVTLPYGHVPLPLTSSIPQIASWLELKKTKMQQVADRRATTTARVDAHSLVVANSGITSIDRDLFGERL